MVNKRETVEINDVPRVVGADVSENNCRRGQW